jgi:hypothetical protein
MYYLLLVLMIITFQKKGSAQTYVPFPDSNAIWREHHAIYYSGIGMVCSELQYYIQGDTVINGITYRNVWSIGYSGLPVVSCSTYFGQGPALAYRESNKRIFCIKYLYNNPSNPPSSSTPEFILYDFNLSLGDTFAYPVHFTPLMFGNTIITHVDSTLVFNSYRKVYFLTTLMSMPPSPADSNYVAIIEGIGSTYGLIGNLLKPNWQEKYDELTCFRHNVNDYSPWGDPCNYLTTEEAPQPQPEVKIYPNPARDFITIEDMEGQYTEIMLMDLSGRVILKENISGRQLIKSVSLNPVGNGLYVCWITSKSGNRYSSKVAVVK